MDDDSGEVNRYRELVVNNAEKVEIQKTQMEAVVNTKYLTKLCTT